MTNNKLVFIALLVVGVLLLAFGVSASESVSSDFSRLFTGEPTDRAVWFLLGGAVATVVGIGGLARGSR